MTSIPHVLFVCLHGAGKSVLAAADFERMAQERGLPAAAAAPDGARIEQWEDVPAVSDGLPAARAVIRRHLERLVDGWSAS